MPIPTIRKNDATGFDPSRSLQAGGAKPLEFSPQQQEAMDRIEAWLIRSLKTKGPSEFRLGGYAGTGKTTIAKKIISIAESRGLRVAAASFTGKAASVLRTKGVPDAQTLHALLYHARMDVESDGPHYVPRDRINADLILVDESSMISLGLYQDLLRHGKQLLFVGDPAQLEPVGQNPDLMKRCDYVLTEIHRQGARSPILRLAQAIRLGRKGLEEGTWGDDERGRVTITGREPEDLTAYDIVICARNATRHRINARIRAQQGHRGLLTVGERVICLKNSSDYGIQNGEIRTISAMRNYRIGLVGDLDDEFGGRIPSVPLLTCSFGRDAERHEWNANKDAVPFDYGNAITAHKAQGSQWRRTLVIDEGLPMTNRDRLRYTMFTRAEMDLTVVTTA